jgi:hypothetical protein
MSQLRNIVRPEILLLVLSVFSVPGCEDASAAYESSGSYYERLAALSSGDKELSPAATQEFEATAYDPLEGLAGVKLGMSMEDVIGIWGLPKRICIQNAATVLSIARGSQFSFVENELVSVKIHSADLPGMKLSNGLDFSYSPSQLSSLYKTRNLRGRTYVADLAEDIELQFFYYTRADQEPTIITIAVVRKP